MPQIHPHWNELIYPAGSSQHGPIWARSRAASASGTFALESWAATSMFLAGMEWVPPQSSKPRPRSSGRQKHVINSTSHTGYSPKTCRSGNNEVKSKIGQRPKYYTTTNRYNLYNCVIQIIYSCCLKCQLCLYKIACNVKVRYSSQEWYLDFMHLKQRI